VKVPTLKKSSTNEYFSPHRHFINNGKRTFIWLRLKQPWKDTNKKVLSKIDLSSPIDKSDQQDSTMFCQGTIKSDILQLMLLLCL
jgi:hypothetical protein